MMKLIKNTTLLAVATIALVGCDTATPTSQPVAVPSTGISVPTAPPAAGIGVAEPLRVVYLMEQVDCKGRLIDTQLFAQETGRCLLHNYEVTFAVFQNNNLRDQWIGFGMEFGGNFVAGDRWAAATENPDAAKIIAVKLGGQRL